MAPDTNAWAHLGALGALGAYFPLSAPRARACNDYTELAPDAPIAPNCCELHHDWQAQHPRKSRRDRAGCNPWAVGPIDRLGTVSRSSAIQIMGGAND